MTVLTTKSDISYAGLAGQVSFAYDFRVDNKTDMNVTINGVAVSQAGFTMTGIGSALGGTVTLVEQLTDPATVILFRVLPITQETDYQPFDPFPAETHEQALDKLTMLIQQGNSALLNAIRFPVGDDADPVLPIVADRAGRSFGFDANGDISLFLGDDSGDPQAVQKPIGAAIDNNLMMFDAFKNALDSGFSIASLIEMFLPIGSVLTYTNGTLNPNTFIPGTFWELMPEAEFLVSQGASFPGGTTGGTADSVVIDHTHPMTANGDHAHGLGNQVVTIDAPFDGGIDPQSGDAPSGSLAAEATTGQHQHTLSNTGVDGTGLNIPPYRSVWRWERVSSPTPSTPEFDAHWARVTDKSDPTLETDLRLLFADLIANGLWDILDDLSVIHSSASDSVLGLKGFQDSLRDGLAPTDWSTLRGFRVGDTNLSGEVDPNKWSWIDTQISDTGSTNLSVGSITIFSHPVALNGVLANFPYLMGVIDTLDGSRFSVRHSGNTNTLINIGDETQVQSNTGGALFYLGTQDAPLTGTFISGGETIPMVLDGLNIAPLVNIYMGSANSNNNGAAPGTTPMTWDLTSWGVGGGMTQAQAELLKGIITVYETARGVI